MGNNLNFELENLLVKWPILKLLFERRFIREPPCSLLRKLLKRKPCEVRFSGLKQIKVRGWILPLK
jgi:hypothetical protein